MLYNKFFVNYIFGILSFVFINGIQQVMALDLDVKTLINQSKKYILDEQVKTKTPGKMLGEWPSYMMNDKKMPRLGWQGKKAYDSNSFLTSNISNILSRIYLSNPNENFDLLPSLLLAHKNIDEYRTGETYGFWPYMENDVVVNSRDLKSENVSPLRRRSVHYSLDSRPAVNAANVPDDADDTAVAYLSNYYYQKIRSLNESLLPEPLFISKSLSEQVDSYRDRNRKSLHHYNVMNGFHLFTGAYMTWFSKEPFFTPWSWYPGSETKPYIPYGSNEVDCVVNANVLIGLMKYNEIEKSKGSKASCHFIKEIIRKKEFSTCGVYYPNKYHSTYVISKAVNSEVPCLQDETSKIFNFVTSTQNEDGSFSSPSSSAKWKQFFLRNVYK